MFGAAMDFHLVAGEPEVLVGSHELEHAIAVL
jgi:hypothetical protein